MQPTLLLRISKAVEQLRRTSGGNCYALSPHSQVVPESLEVIVVEINPISDFYFPLWQKYSRISKHQRGNGMRVF
jgi:hypothetical protein